MLENRVFVFQSQYGGILHFLGWFFETRSTGSSAVTHEGRRSDDVAGNGPIGVRANIHLGGQTEFCPNGKNNLFVTRPRQGEKIIMNYCSACF